MQIHRFILGSKSPYRRALLEEAGLPCTTIEASVDEKSIVEATPRLTALARARAKALAVAKHCLPGDLVLGADQVLGYNGAVFDKSPDEHHARLRLKELQGQTHVLHSAMVLVLVPVPSKDTAIEQKNPFPKSDVKGLVVLSSLCVDTSMTMRPLNNAEIEAYLRTGEWQGSVGCYKYEKLGIQLFSASNERGTQEDLGSATADRGGLSIDQSAIVGLPLRPLFEVLRRIGVNPLLSPHGPWTYRHLSSEGGDL